MGQVVTKRAVRFERDGVSTLVTRLANNVVKTGLRRLNVSYSRISLEDVRVKLGLDDVRSAEFVCAKAIADGVIDATLDHDAKTMHSNDIKEIYATTEPQIAFHRRVTFCLDVHNEALKAMMYPPQLKLMEDADATAKQDEAKSEEEIAKEIEDELEDEGL